MTRTASSTTGDARRSRWEAAITSYVAEHGETGYAATVAGNMLRSFLIHNGVYMQGRPSID